MKNKKTILKMVVLAILSALIVVLQLIATLFRIGEFQLSFVLIPIAVGAILCGPLAGTYLGLLFGLVVLLNGDAAAFLAINPFGCVVAVLGKGAAAGAAAGWVFKLLKNKNLVVAIILAAMAAPVANTGVFAISALTIFKNGIYEMFGASGGQIFSIVFVTLIGVNFFIEFGLTAVLSPAISRICMVGFDQLKLK